eukprot:11112519-Alexandrium_andersonii.AAC.1
MVLFTDKWIYFRPAGAAAALRRAQRRAIDATLQSHSCQEDPDTRARRTPQSRPARRPPFCARRCPQAPRGAVAARQP